MCPVHLRMVELERNGERGFQQAAFVFAPNQERIIENAAIHTDCTVDFVACQCGSAYNHAFSQVMVGAAFSHLPCKLQITLVELG